MRKTVAVIVIGLIIFLASSWVFGDLRDLSGRWSNSDPNTRGITALHIDLDHGQINVQAWGQAHPRDIDWGMVPASAYSDSVRDNPFQGADVLTAVFQTNFNETLLIIRPQGLELQVETFTRFTDNSRRSNYHAVYRFHRAGRGGNWPGQPDQPGYSWPQSLEPPQQLSPVHGSVFRNYPRRTTLRWSPVNGAQSYCVEIDYYDFNWLTDQGKTYIVVPNLADTTYTFHFVGAQAGRWRVWAVDGNGREGPKSNWWEFKYTR